MDGHRVLNSGLIEQVSDHQQAIMAMAEQISAQGHIENLADLDAIEHRVVHGGECFKQPTLINSQTIEAIEQLIPLATLHNPANVLGIKMAGSLLRMYHRWQSLIRFFMPTCRIMPIPTACLMSCIKNTISAVMDFTVLLINMLPVRLISLHLGNGASAAAVLNGQSIDTSMGMTPLEVLLMGSRSGDIDPAILFYLARETGADIDTLDALLNKQSGLKGLCGQNDMRTIIEQIDQGDELSTLAIHIFCYRIKKYIGAYAAALNGIDGLIFTGGIGENSSFIRKQVCTNMDELGIIMDSNKNQVANDALSELHNLHSKVKILAVKTNEELEIALQTQQLLGRDGSRLPCTED